MCDGKDHSVHRISAPEHFGHYVAGTAHMRDNFAGSSVLEQLAPVQKGTARLVYGEKAFGYFRSNADLWLHSPTPVWFALENEGRYIGLDTQCGLRPLGYGVPCFAEPAPTLSQYTIFVGPQELPAIPSFPSKSYPTSCIKVMGVSFAQS